MTKNKSLTKHVIFLVLGMILLIAGAIIAKNTREVEDHFLKALPYLAIGLGSGIFGNNLANILQIHFTKTHPKEARRKEIDENDERNITIRNKAKAKAYDMMIFVYGALMLTFAVIDLDFRILLTFIVAYLFIAFTNVYYIGKYGKEL